VADLSGRSTAVIALTIGRLLFTAVSSKPTIFALLDLEVENTSHLVPKAQVSASPYKCRRDIFLVGQIGACIHYVSFY
jgi:hypothetical protein